MDELLKVENLSVEFAKDDGHVRAIDGISFDIQAGETVCIVGESGSGKSVTSLAIMRLLEYENGRISSGDIRFEGESIVAKTQAEMRQIRSNGISMIFQEPMTALNPVFTIGRQMTEGMLAHQKLSKKAAWERACQLLDQVGINDVQVRMKQYPHELSGGMRQRVMIAMALAGEPKLLIADEPTTALDVTIESQILSLLNELREEKGLSIMLITHDMGVAAQVADRIIVMYAGKIVEEGSVYELFEDPKHPYTKGLLQSIPNDTGPRQARLFSIPGSIPSLTDLPTGCRFHPRCAFATDQCRRQAPETIELEGRKLACWNT